jgi:hypothetical protein
MKRIALAAATFASLVLPASLSWAGAVEDSMLEFINTQARTWFADPLIIATVQKANLANGTLSPNDILTLDAKWQAEVGTDSALIKGVSESAASSYLRDRVSGSGGTVTEIILMDAQGLNVAISDVTSDYWQGDEAKHQKSFGAGASGVHLSEVELDESTQTYQAQVSFTLTDPATGMAIGAVTIGLNAESF